jgi:hypothetical protein
VNNLYIDREDYTVRVDAESHPGFLRICMQPTPAGCGNRHKKFACIAHQVGGFFRFLFPSLAFFICIQPVSHSHTLPSLCGHVALFSLSSDCAHGWRSLQVPVHLPGTVTCARGGSTRWFQISLPA